MPDAPSPTDDGSRSVVIEEREANGPATISASVGTVTVIADDVRTMSDHTPDNGSDSRVPIDLARWAELAALSLNDLGANGELQLSFVDVDEISELNREHMGSDGPTDVLSFPLDGLADEESTADPGSDDSASADSASADSGSADSASAGATALQPTHRSGPPRLLGDVVICPAVAADNAPSHAGTVDDELALLVVHGVLHVLGYDHAEPDETEQMRAQESELLTRHHWNGPVPAGFSHEHLDDRAEPGLTAGAGS